MDKRKYLKILVVTFFIIALFVLLIVLAGANPITSVGIMFQSVFGNANGFAEVFVKAIPLILISLGAALSFRTGFFNIGGEGQFYIGALAASVVALKLTTVPGVLRIFLCIVVAFLFGGLWALIPAMMKAKLDISETVSTIMMNYIATMLVGILIRGWLQEPGSSLPQTAKIDESCRFLCIWQPTRLHLGILLAIICTVALWFILNHSTLGFEMRMVGSSPRVSLCMGLPVTRSLLASATISGGLAGLAGVNELLGVQFRLLEGLSGGIGYTAILIALLAKNNPVYVAVVALIYSMFQTGASSMQRLNGVPSALVQIITGVVVVVLLGYSVGDKVKTGKAKKKEGSR